MGMLRDIEERKFEKKVERLEELEEKRVGKKAQLTIHCSEMADQFIDYTDFIPYNEGISEDNPELISNEDDNTAEIESPTGEPLKVSMYKTTNEESMKIGVLGDEESTLAGLMDWIRYGDSSVGVRSYNKIIQSVLILTIGSLLVWLYMALSGELQGTGNLMDSKVFIISATFTLTLIVSVFIQQSKRKSDNFLSGHFLCVGHSEGKDIHYLIPLSNNNYMDLLTAWFGRIDFRVLSMLKQLSKKNLETIDNLEQDNRELRIKLEDERGRKYEKIADEMNKNKVDYRHLEKQSSSKAVIYSIITATISVLVTILVYQYVILGA